MLNLLNVLNFLDGECSFATGNGEDPTETILGILYLVKLVIRILRIAVPFGLILFGTLDMGKAVIAGDEKKIKEAQKPFVKRIIAAVIVFLIPTIVEAVISFAAPKSNFKACWDAAVEGVKISPDGSYD